VPRIIWDFETASACSIDNCGAAGYAQHPTTEGLCLVWKREGDSTHGVWTPLLPEFASLDELRELVSNPDNVFVSHSAFEQFIWQAIMVPLGLPPIPLERWEDTQATAAWRSRPLALERLMKSLGCETQKDMEGSAITIGLSKPMTKVAWGGLHYDGIGTMAAHMRRFPAGTLDRSRATIERVIAYCKIDVDCEEEALRRLGDLSSAERGVWLLDQEINHRGIRLDMSLVHAMQVIVWKATETLEQKFGKLTGGLGSGQTARITEWCAAQGVVLKNLQKEYIAKLIGFELEDEDDAGYESLAGEQQENTRCLRPEGMPDNVRRVLEIRLMLGSASIKKLERMQHCVCDDGRARGLCQYHAAHSGRWGGRLLQPQNFPRGSIRLDADTACAAVRMGDPATLEYAVRQDAYDKLGKARDGGDPLKFADAEEYYEKVSGMGAIEMVASCLRFVLIPAPGHVFLVGDYAGIEMRVVLALAGQRDKCELLATGKDVYLDMADDIYKKPRGYHTKTNVAERTIGKNTVLGCGFQMGGPKFHARYCPEQKPQFAQDVVTAYRTQWAPKVPILWKTIGDVALAVVTDGKSRGAYGCRFFLDRGYLGIDLPTGRQTLWYPDIRRMSRHEIAELTKKGVELDAYRIRYAKMDERQKAWENKLAPTYKKYGNPERWCQLYGGLLTENIVQAIARGILVAAMFRLKRAGYRIVLTVHDEIVCEAPEPIDYEQARLDFKAIMEDTAGNASWVKDMGVPISVDAWVGPRYKK
jgi:DNA polymerase